MTSIREFLIIYGGYENISGEDLNELWIYNTINGVWKRYQTPIDIKDTCLSASICSIGNLVYIFGGDSFGDGRDYRQSNSIVSFDFVNETWSIVYPHTDDYDENTPPPMCENLLLYHNGSLYVLGGIHDCYKLDTIYKFCLKTSTWALVPQYGVKQIFHSKIFGTVRKNK
ncbi:hypothetical protein RF11_12990 [Thelohanellus kitauei]|uniref:Kelch domain-containing protein 10 n=1 Tax=Thelohanellus kitauei TaxID=669202 RepID=A0A0C2JZ05_THEKT|nr:hypothetical protein RF11_12990 [Thelohanellus kitauei]